MSHYEQGAGEGLLVAQISLYLLRYKIGQFEKPSVDVNEGLLPFLWCLFPTLP